MRRFIVVARAVASAALLAMGLTPVSAQQPKPPTARPDSTARVARPTARPDSTRRATPPATRFDSTRRAALPTTRRDSGGRDTTRAEASDSTPARGMPGALAALLKPRLIGAAGTGGRISSIAVHPENPGVMYIGVASGGVFKTDNGGATWTPIFDRQSSFSIGAVVLDPRNPGTVWVGTGENNSQRSVAFGDGVYRSDDAGKSWKRMGLEKSEHIARILIDPRNSDVVYVAAQGPLWADGGERGLYKTIDGGKSWTSLITVSERTGVTDVVMDPRNPDILIAATWQRRRHFYTLINGGPESALHRSTDAGKSWKKITSGLPTGTLGRIGLAISPKDPDVVYATIESAPADAGIFRSVDGGVNWEKRSPYTAQPMYYATLVTDPFNVQRLYSMDVTNQLSEDGGATWKNLGERSKHVDNHALWIDPRFPDHYINGNDGGLYQTWDAGRNWIFFGNLPITQFYDVDVSTNGPFYRVCGGTQDNNSLCGPAATRSTNGILNTDWFITNGGDGFVSRIDPEDPNTIYAESQGGGMVRFDARTGEAIGIRPEVGRGEAPSRWNWDTPIIISPHARTRLYTASQRLYRSDDRGNSWKALSGDLTRSLDRNALPVMGKVWGPDAVAKNQSTAFYSNISQIAESQKQEGLLYVGTDDGLVQVSENGGVNWRKTDSIPGVPANAYIQRLITSRHDARTVFVAVNNHQNGDFAPYLLRSTDAGRRWESIAGDLPKRGTVYGFAEDHVDPKLLFAGTEFGAYVSKDGGAHWLKIPGLPTIQVRDIAIQRGEDDLVLGTFGRGIYVVDDYSSLRDVSTESLAAAVKLYPMKDAISFVRRGPFGGTGKGAQGEALFTAANPDYGAQITYSLKEAFWTSKKDKRVEAQKAAEKSNKPISYPTPADFIAEAEEEPVVLGASIADASGRVWRVVTLPVARGAHRVTWDLRGDLDAPGDGATGTSGARGAGGGGGGGGGGAGGGFGGAGGGAAVPPGKYTVTLMRREKGVQTPLAGPVSFSILHDPAATTTVADREANLEFRVQAQKLTRQIAAASEVATAAKTKMDAIVRVLDQMPQAPKALADRARDVNARLALAIRAIRGDAVNASRGEQVPVSIQSFANNASPDGMLAPPTTTNREQYAIATADFATEYAKLKPILTTELPAIEQELERLGAPPTPGRIPALP
ncbi:MAG: glycosyl hydrolase [Gemmatimonadota bacterium]